MKTTKPKTKLKNRALVLMATFNGEKFIAKQIESIENQKTDLPFDILIRDDGSTDNTVKIIRKQQKKYKNIKLIKGKNIGCNASFFELFSLAEGYEYYLISDQDDLWMDFKIQRGFNSLKKEAPSTPLLYGSYSELIDENDNLLNHTTQKQHRKLTLKNTIIQNIIPGHSMMFNNQLLNLLKQQLNSEKIYVYDYWVTNVAALYGKILFDDIPTTKYRVHNANTIGYGQTKLQWVKERLKRFSRGDGASIFSQIQYFFELYQHDMPEDIKHEIKNFLDLNTSFRNRLKFILTTKLHRQKRPETTLFKLAYLKGSYADQNKPINSKKISVALASYNGEKYIKAQIESILKNLAVNDEIIISDDGSVDNTVKIVKNLRDKRIKIIDGPKKGIIKNFENALNHCSGDFIFLSDQDDLWTDDKVQKVMDTFAKHRCDLVLHDCDIFDEYGTVADSFFELRKTKTGRFHNIAKNGYIGCCLAFRKQILDKILPFPDNIPMHDQWIGLVSEKFGKVALLDEKLIHYRRHDHNATKLSHLSFTEMLKNRANIILSLMRRK